MPAVDPTLAWAILGVLGTLTSGIVFLIAKVVGLTKWLEDKISAAITQAKADMAKDNARDIAQLRVELSNSSAGIQKELGHQNRIMEMNHAAAMSAVAEVKGTMIERRRREADPK